MSTFRERDEEWNRQAAELMADVARRYPEMAAEVAKAEAALADEEAYPDRWAVQAAVRIAAMPHADDEPSDGPPDDVVLLGEGERLTYAQFEPTPLRVVQPDDEPDRPDVICVADMQEPVDTETWLIEGMLRPGAVLVLAAAEGVGKSYMRKEAEIRLATGNGSLFGHFAIPEALNVVTFEEENGEAEEWRREEQVMKAIGVARYHLRGLHRVSYPGINLTKAADQRYVREQIEVVGAEVVFFDTGGSMTGDEWGTPIKEAMAFLRSLPCAVVVFVHLVKPQRGGHGPAPEHGASLSDVMGQWTRAAAVVVTAADLGEQRVRLRVQKRAPHVTLILVQRDGLWVVVEEVAPAAQKARDEMRVLEAINDGVTHRDDLAEHLDIPKRTLNRAIRMLRNDRLIDDSKHPYVLTESGTEAIGD